MTYSVLISGLWDLMCKQTRWSCCVWSRGRDDGAQNSAVTLSLQTTALRHRTRDHRSLEMKHRRAFPWCSCGIEPRWPSRTGARPWPSQSSPVGSVLMRLQLSFTFLFLTGLFLQWAQEAATQSPFICGSTSTPDPFFTHLSSPPQGTKALKEVQ